MPEDELDFLDTILDSVEIIEPIEGEEDSLNREFPEIEITSEEELLKEAGVEAEESEEEESADEDEDTPPAPKDSTSEYFKAVAEGLYKLGEFGELPKDIEWNQDTFIQEFKKASKISANNEIENLLTAQWGEEGIEMFNDIFVKKVDITNYLSKYAEIQDFEKIDLDNVNNQKLIIKEYLKLMDKDDEEIDEQLEFYESKEKLEEVSTKFKTKLIENNKAEMKRLANEREFELKKQVEATEKRNSQVKEVLASSLKNNEILGIPLSIKDNIELIPYLLEPAYRTKSGQEISEMQKDLIELQKDPAKFIALGKLIKEGLNITPIKQKAVDEKKEEVFDFKNAKQKPTQKIINNSIIDELIKRKIK